MSVGEITGRNLKKCVLALGGSDPFIVLDSVNMDKTVATAAFGRLANTGQSCVAAKRFIVMADLYEEFVSRLARTFATPRPGDPADAATTLGALSSERAGDLIGQVRDTVDKGRHGGNRRRAPRA